MTNPVPHCPSGNGLNAAALDPYDIPHDLIARWLMVGIISVDEESSSNNGGGKKKRP